MKQYTGSSCGMVFNRQSMTRKSALRSSGGPLLEALVLFASWVPDWSAPGSTPAKAVMEFLWVKRVTSPISAMSCGPRESPTPRMAMTTGYSGSWAARVRISALSRSRDAETAFSASMACRTTVLVRASFGSMAIKSCARAWISTTRLWLKL